MKRKVQTVEEMVMHAHYLEALEIESKSESPLSAMERQSFIDEIQGLKAMIESLQQSLDIIKCTLKTQNDTIASLQKTVEEKDERIAYLQSLVNRNNQERFDRTGCQRRNRKENRNIPSVHKDRIQEEDAFVSTKDDDSSGKPVDSSVENSPEKNEPDGGVHPAKVKSENMNGERQGRGHYTLMDAAKVVRLRTSLDGAPVGMKFLGYKEIEEYTKKSYVECTIFEVAVYEDEFGNRHEYYKAAKDDDSRKPYLNTIPNTHCTPELLADAVIEKYMMFVPVHRESIRHELDKFQVSENTIRNWLSVGARMLNPILFLLKQKLLKVKSILNIDETWTRVRIKFVGDGTKLGHYMKKYVWVLVNKLEGITYFFYDNDENDSRGYRPIQTFLGDFLGAVQSDGYVVYKQLAKDHPGNEHLMCWAHVHNKFEQVYKSCKDKTADWFTQMIGRLYAIESECRLAHLSPNKIKSRRNMKDVDGILKSLFNKGSDLLKKKKKHYGEMMRKALHYMIDNWEALVKYRNDGRYTIDNLLAERAVRPFTIDRKNSLSYSSEEGVETAMTYYTIIETCKNFGLNVRDYLVDTFREIMRGNTAYHTLIPCAVAQNK